MSRKLKWGIGIGAIAAACVGYYYFNPGFCRSAKTRYGLELAKCPEGDLKQVAMVRAEGLSRTKVGTVRVSAKAIYTTSKADEVVEAAVETFDVALNLIAADGTKTPLKALAESEKDRAAGKKGTWRSGGGSRHALFKLPAVDDGDYKLRATVISRVGESEVDVALPVYAPAKIHILTDRPLYEPGNVVQFRGLALRASDLSPIDRRPGKWVVSDPAGEVLLEEKVSAVDWGVVSGTFPLDSEAAHGTWTVRWQSGADSGTQTFRVEPFTLPRFAVTAKPERPFYGRGERPVLSGKVTYSSGAPVPLARIEATWSASGDWPPPPEWLKSELPQRFEVDGSGRFSVTLPPVPDDLRRGQATLIATLNAFDPAGDRVASRASVLLSADPIAVTTVTELEGGLVKGANNRLYLRVTTADGRPLASGTKVNVKRGWQPGDEGIDTVLDADAVGRLQVDPGPPVNIVVPPMPVRPVVSDDGQEVMRVGARDLVSGNQASLADRRAMDSWNTALATCSRWATGSERANVGARVSESGQVLTSVGDGSEIAACVAKIVIGKRLPNGAARLYSLSFRFADPKLPTVTIDNTHALNTDGDVEELIQTAALDARACVDDQAPARFGDAVAFQLSKGEISLKGTWIRASKEPPMSAATKKCIMAAISRPYLEEPSETDDIGVLRFRVSVPAERRVVAPQPTIMKGYELLVSATLPDGEAGTTTLRMTPGAIPNIRMRATPVVAQPGQSVEIAVLRGPNYESKLPKKLFVRHLGDIEKIDLDPKTKVARFVMPDDASGWYTFDGIDGTSARVFVKSRSELAVSIAAEKPSYQPGDSAKLILSTTIGGQGSQAAVGLFGVDATLGQIASLAGPEELSSVRPQIAMTSGPAFGTLDAQALTVGRIRGANAAEATVLRVGSIPKPSELDAEIHAHGETAFDPIAVLTDRFYPILAELHRRSRDWERSAPPGDVATNQIFARLWKKSLATIKKSGGDVTDAYGRELRLHRLPSDLLALTEPRQVVVVGTRLPEDFENWSAWVQKEKP